MITYNGNEMMLQNDMGNTLILDSATGNIMGLSPGFVPIGMKEHGGIMYIASVDKNGNGEIGTIPSPIIRDIYKDKVTFEVNQPIPVNIGDPIRISNKLYPADKFIVNLQMEIEEGSESNKIEGADVYHKDSDLSSANSSDPSDFILKRSVVYKSELTDIYTPLISYAPDFTDFLVSLHEKKDPVDLFSTKGIYKMSLLSTNTNGQKVEDSLTNCLVYGDSGDRSKYWFTHSNFISDIFPKDLLMATLNSDLKQFPSSNKPGELAIKLETESVGKFDILPRKDGLTVPITFKDSANYTTYFPGFYYSTDSGLYIDKLSNIKIIDESLNEDILNNTSSVEFKNYKLEDINNYKEIGENDESIETWECEHLPQTKTSNEENPNTFILSNIKSITNHTETNLRSSTKGVDESPHTGVITVNLGEKYNNWYRLELDYYDLYGEKQGVFTKRFNPYINDVFGTNLKVDGKSYGDKLAMGPNNIQISGQIDTTYKINTKGKYIYFKSPKSTSSVKKVGTSWDWDEMVNVYYTDVTDDTTNKFLYEADSLGYEFTPPNTLDTNVLYLSTNSPTTTYQTIDAKPTISLPLHHGKSNLILTSPGKERPYLATIFMGGDVNISNKFNSGCEVEDAPGTAVFTMFGFDNLPYYFDNNYTGDLAYLNKFTICAYDGDYIDSKEKLSYNYNRDRRFEGTIGIDGSNKITLSFSPSVHGLVGTLYRQAQTTKIIDDGDFGGSDTRKRWCYDSMLFLVEVPLDDTTTISNIKVDYKNTYTPSYSITPYFCLTGTSEDGSSAYVQRLKIDGQNLVFKHNFETNPDLTVHNYILTVDNSTKSSIHQLSYTFKTPFYFYKNKLAYKLRLDAGIYVLNIQRCPGQAEPAPFTLNEESNLLIKIGPYSKTISDYEWRIQPIYSDEITNSGMRESDINAYIYRPIVLIVPTSCEVEVSTDNKFYRQNVGLYKIKNVNKEDIVELKATLEGMLDDIIFYDLYMWALKTTIEGSFINDIKKYNFIQKYGVFFKEAYVFIDGLISEDNVIKLLTIGDIRCLPFPYIPSDPSVLPVGINSDYQEFIWNAYIIPESVLHVTDVNDYPKFKFSNPLEEEYSTEPADGNLRQKI